MTIDRLDFLVIVPTYRRPEFLAQALRSALVQNNVSKRIIVVDDCPNGSAREVAESMGPCVVYLRNPRPTGGWPGKVRNYGFEISRAMGIQARFVHFLDDDDTVPAGHYENVKRAFGDNPQVGVVFGVLEPFCVFSQDLERRRRQETRLAQIRQEFSHAARVARIYHHIGSTMRMGALRRWLYRSHALIGGNLFLCSGAVIRHEHVIELGAFDPHIRITEDYEFFTRAIVAKGVHFLGRISANYRVGGADSLWNPMELSTQAEVQLRAEVARLLQSRYLRLQSEFGAVRLKLTAVAFHLATWIIDSLLIPLLDRCALVLIRREKQRRRTPGSNRALTAIASGSR
jgi:GT2 family glycosyltransferase